MNGPCPSMGRLVLFAKTIGRNMPEAHNTTLVAAIDCPGGGQVWIDGTTLFVAHMNPPSGTSISRSNFGAFVPASA